MENKNKQTIIAVVLVILVIIVLIVSNIFNKTENKDSINILTDYNEFYTVNSCIYRFITYVNSKDESSLNLILTDKYKNKEKNGKENLFSEIPENATFVSKKMYYEKQTENITKYYVYGYVTENILNEFENNTPQTSKTLYFIVYLDSKNLTFLIEPYDGKIFDGGNESE